MATISESLKADLAAKIDAEWADSALATLALAVAAKLDNPNTGARDYSVLARVLRDCISDLHRHPARGPKLSDKQVAAMLGSDDEWP